MKKKQRITLGISVLILLVLVFGFIPAGMYGLVIRKNRLIYHSTLPEEYC